MANFSIKSFSRIDVLKTVDPQRLIKFLSRYQEFFDKAGMVWPKNNEPIDYDRLTRIFMSPDAQPLKPPSDLLTALWIINDMSDQSGMDAIIDGGPSVGLIIEQPEKRTPIDIAIDAWMQDPDFVRAKHAVQLVWSRQSFQYYLPTGRTTPVLPQLSDDRMALLKAALQDFYLKKGRSGTVQIEPFDMRGSVWFLISHGLPLTRLVTLEDGTSSAIVVRPEHFDVVVFDKTRGDLWVNSQTVGERKNYIASFGKCLFGKDDIFKEQEKYTLEPLRTLGKDSLNCQNIPGLKKIVLKEIQIAFGGMFAPSTTRKASNLFSYWESTGDGIPHSGKITKAVFEVTFDAGNETRSVTVYTPNRIKCHRNEDSPIIEAWLESQQFIASPPEDPFQQSRGKDTVTVLADDRKLAGLARQPARVENPAG